MKRCFDILFSLTMISVLLPVFLFVGLGVFFSVGAPVFYRQRRVGKDDVIFYIVKFRSMSDERDAQDKLLPNAQRVTKFGKFIRNSSLDELPGLFNILKGEMSVVGPRPLLPEYLPFYKDKHRRRHKVKPGLTGLAQVNGRNLTTWDARLNFDLQYVDNQNFINDLKILLKTVVVVLSRRGVTGNSDLSIVRLDQDKQYLEGASPND